VTARQVFRQHVKGKNVMTPNHVEYGDVDSGRVYEITSGTGFDNEPIFGVTVIARTDGKLQMLAGGLFHALGDAREHVKNLSSAEVAL
jgi:hypothetical protein